VSGAESCFRKAFVTRRRRGLPDMEFWTTVKRTAMLDDNVYINWNCLTYEPLPARTRNDIRKNNCRDLFYYGAFRAGRESLFDRYFLDSPVPVKISSTNAKFSERYGIEKTIPALPRDEFYLLLARHGLGLYIEDAKSSREFHSPANRFYEMLSAGLPMVFQPESADMLSEAGYDVAPYIIHGLGKAARTDIKRLMRNSEDIGAAQRKAWSRGYVQDLEKAVKAAYVGLC